ncbi:expressed unknown protein [Seminavis robusta]|uniref:Uncharacterized protein n=1 Tax=Seminavis robusta TaxID=568900 RepID=A0A9N8EUJ3_9STRA|nr:expressed unknown protein [Seminavis robusta]|eukprot:Sro1724_g293690.1 n/a (168) ;mRNA; r:10109-10612
MEDEELALSIEMETALPAPGRNAARPAAVGEAEPGNDDRQLAHPARDPYGLRHLRAGTAFSWAPTINTNNTTIGTNTTNVTNIHRHAPAPAPAAGGPSQEQLQRREDALRRLEDEQQRQGERLQRLEDEQQLQGEQQQRQGEEANRRHQELLAILTGSRFTQSRGRH